MMTPSHLALSRKLKDPKRLAKLLEALRNNRPAWTMGIQEPEDLILETLKYMQVTI
jgi:hypothetical protein